MPKRSLRIDLHVKVLDERVVARAKARGLDALVYAPHFVRLPEIRRRAAAYTDADLAVIPAREVFTGTWRNRKHVLAVGLTEPVPDYVTLASAMAELDRQGAAVLVPHPEFATVSLGEADLRTYRDELHAIETYNPKHLGVHNRRAGVLSDSLDLPPFASSYAHLRSTVGEVWTAFPGVEATEAALVDALREGHPRTIEHRTGFAHRLRCCLEVGHLSYENSISKVYHFMRGPKATNPHHPVYEGRFDEEAVYSRAWFDYR